MHAVLLPLPVRRTALEAAAAWTLCLVYLGQSPATEAERPGGSETIQGPPCHPVAMHQAQNEAPQVKRRPFAAAAAAAAAVP